MGVTAMPSATFDQAYPLARRAAEVRAAHAVRSRGLGSDDRQDAIQDSLTACWRAFPQFDPNRASLATFIECVVATRICSFVRSARRRPKMDALEICAGYGRQPDVNAWNRRIDVRALLKTLDDDKRRLAVALLEDRPADVARKLGISRSTVYLRMRSLRRDFSDVGLTLEGL